ncbi:hypothetical protein BCR34DRAFT_103619 [Clohesyomyces aquaticus]|uniref:Uncharacterized protein n=1 Tax=Clohesyomyces aquaticus TaxID=1231657 RepID=A0A1Y2A1K7_9PLEO|nr:hypothetical protein BCR34DRAFT_103619 [Clohesyomyces aquaticus]
MATLHLAPPPRTPSPKIRIHRSQSFDSPSTRFNPITPIDESPCSKSLDALIAKPLPTYSVLARKSSMSDEEILSDCDSSSSSAMSSIQNSPQSMASPTAERSSPGFPFPSAPSPPLSHSMSMSDAHSTLPRQLAPYPPSRFSLPNSNPNLNANPLPTLSESVESPLLPPPSLLPFQIPSSSTSPTYDPWLVRVVLDMFDVRGFDWMSIADLVERVWRRRTSSAEVLGILGSNGRVGVMWWD